MERKIFKFRSRKARIKLIVWNNGDYLTLLTIRNQWCIRALAENEQEFMEDCFDVKNSLSRFHCKTAWRWYRKLIKDNFNVVL